MTAPSDTATQSTLPGRLRKMELGEYDRFAQLIETAFAEDQARAGRNYRDEVRNLQKLLPLFRILFAVKPSLEAYFCTFVWEVEDCFVSAVTLMRQGNDARRWFIANVATHPAYRGRGLARTLVTAALERIRIQGGHYALLHVRADNEPAYRLYRSLGFQQLESITTLKGTAPLTATPARPETAGVSEGYTLRPISITDWRTRFVSAQGLASPETRSICPPTEKQFQISRSGRSLQALLNRAQHVRAQTWAIEAAAQPIGLVTCQAQRSGSNPHRVQIEIAPEHWHAEPLALAQAINFCREQRSCEAHPILIELQSQSQDLIDELRDQGFTRIETMHELGMSVL